MLYNFQTLINSMATHLGLDYDASDFSEKIWTFDGREVTISYTEANDELRLQCIVTEFPEEDTAWINKELLKGNYFFLQTGGSSLSTDADRRVIQQAYYKLQRLDYHKFERMLSNFLDTADSWQNALASREKTPDDPPAAMNKFFQQQFRI